MIHLLLKIIGAHGTDALDIADWSLEFRGANFGLLLLAGLGLAVLTVWLYRRGAMELRPGWRYTLAGLRVVFFAAVLALVMQPVLQLGIDGKVRRSFVVLLDATSSMRIQDARSTDADLQRAAIAKGVLDARAGLGQPLDRGKAR